jgi:hypothetical protein
MERGVQEEWGPFPENIPRTYTQNIYMVNQKKKVGWKFLGCFLGKEPGLGLLINKNSEIGIIDRVS